MESENLIIITFATYCWDENGIETKNCISHYKKKGIVTTGNTLLCIRKAITYWISRHEVFLEKAAQVYFS